MNYPVCFSRPKAALRPLNYLAGVLVSLLMANAQAERLLIENVRIFDGRSLHSSSQVLIDGANIVSLNPDAQQLAGVQRLDAQGKTLLPGLIDAHVHAFQGQDLPLLFGVTSQIDMFSDVRLMQQFHQQRAHDLRHADIFSAGTLATAPGGHGTEYGLTIPTLTQPDQAEAWVAARVAEGSHFIKIVIESHGSFKSLDAATVAALVKAAHRQQKLAVAHIGTLQEARLALQAGVDGLVHLFLGKPLSETEVAEFVALCQQHRAFVIPTFSVLHSMAGIPANALLAQTELTRFLNHRELASLRQTFSKQTHDDLLGAARQTSLALQKAGVTLLAGTDAGNPGTQYGISMHHELAQLVAAGLSPAQALQAATANVAERFGLSDRGRIAAGLRADMMLVEGRPDQNISDTLRIVKVWKAGHDVTALRDQKLAALAQASQQQTPAISLPADGQLILLRDKQLSSPFGMGWFASSDQFAGGLSRASIQAGMLADAPSIRVQAEIKPGFAYPWAGVALICGAQIRQGANLSQAKFLRFKIRGDGQAYQVAFSSAGQFIPVTHSVPASQQWQEVTLALQDFPQVDWRNLASIAFQAARKAGQYEFEIADIRLSVD